MSTPNESEYVVLGCAKSNLSEDSYPFAVVILELESNEHSIKVFLLRGWQNLREFFPDEVRHWILFFMEDLAATPRGEASLLLFRHLTQIGVGAVRSICSGKCKTEDIDSQIAASLDAREYPVLWKTSFRPMEEESQFSTLRELDRNDIKRGRS